MRIGIAPTSFRSAGGVFQHSLAFLDVLREVRSGDDLVVFHRPLTDLPLAQLHAWGFETVESHLLEQPSLVRAGLSRAVNGFQRGLGRAVSGRAWRGLRRTLSESMRSRPWSGDIDTIAHRTGAWRFLFGRHRIELMIYLNETECSFEIGIPYVMAIHDLLHRFHPELPEAFVHGPPGYYEYLYRNAAHHATSILVDSAIGKEDVLEFYGRHGLTADRVNILPLLPAPYLVGRAPVEDIRARYRLPARYLFYPARFWRHKNHARLFEALQLLKTRCHVEIPLVLVGFDASDRPPHGEIPLRDLRSVSEQLGLGEQVRYVGVVPDDDMAGLYAAATALVMPTLCGPSNIPVLEAWQLGCAVLTSDMRGTREQAGDAALLVDPLSVEALAGGMYRLWTDEALRRTLVQRGSERLGSWTRPRHAARLREILEDAKSRPKLPPRP